MGKQSPFENAMIRRFVSPLFLLPPRYHEKSLCVNIGAFWAAGKQWENKNAVRETRGSKTKRAFLKSQGRNDICSLSFLSAYPNHRLAIALRNSRDNS